MRSFIKKLFLNGSPKRRTVSPIGLWTRRVLSISVAVGALIALVLSGCPDDSANGATTTGAYTCENGTPVDGTPSGSSNEVRCQSCVSGYTLSGTAGADGTTCEKDAVTYTCENGTPVDGTPSGTSNVEECKSCTTGFTLTEKKCVAETDNTAPTFTEAPTVDGDPTTTSATVKLTADEASKLFWVVYAGSDASPDTAAALIDAAKGSTVGAQRSGANETVTTTEKTVTLTGLEASTTYNFYAVLQDSAGNIGAVSAKLEITTATTGTKGIYTCENGTAKSGTPTGTSNVEACARCESGYKLMGAANVDGTACVEDSTAPTFIEHPAIKAGSIGATSVTVTLTASELGKLVWVVYINGTQVADAAALINDASADPQPSTVVTKSAEAIVVDTSTDALEITVTGLTKNTPYDFYAVLQDAAQNMSALSTTLDIATATTVKYTCANGAAKTGTPTGNTDVVACTSCNGGFKLNGTAGETNTACVATVYTCENGMPQDGKPTGTADVAECKACNSGFKLMGTACVDTVYTCSNGNAKTGSTDTTADKVACQSCDNGF